MKPKTKIIPSLMQSRRKYILPKSTRFTKIGFGTEASVHSNILVSKLGIKRIAEKKYYTSPGDPHTSPKAVRAKLVNARKTWRLLKKIGFPVPSFYTPILRKNNGVYRILMENLSIKYGEIFPITKNRKPLFLSRLTIKNDSVLIKTLARDLAALHSLGFCPKTMDAWVFYKKSNSYERILVDYGNLQHQYQGFEFIKKHHKNFQELNLELKKIMGQKEYSLFIEEYLLSTKETQIKIPA